MRPEHRHGRLGPQALDGDEVLLEPVDPLGHRCAERRELHVAVAERRSEDDLAATHDVDAAIRRAARLGDCWYVNPHNRIDTIVRQTEVYRNALAELGKPLPVEFPARREVFVAATRQEAFRRCAPHLAVKYAAYHQWGQDRAMPEGDDDLGQDFEELARDRFLIGSVDDVAEQIVRLHAETGINHLVASMQAPGMPQAMVLESMTMLAEEVFPKVRAA